MLRRWGLTVVTVVLGVGVWAACIGDDPASTAERGAQGQRCFDDGTCLSTLVCTKGICEISADGGGSSSSTTSSSGTPGTTSSGGPTDPRELCGILSVTDHAVCPTDPDDADCRGSKLKCCAGVGCTEIGCGALGAQNHPAHDCFSSDHCDVAGATRCCIDATIDDVPMQCGLTKTLAPKTAATEAKCINSCSGAGLELCSVGGGARGCATGKCTRVLMTLTGPSGKEYVRNVNVCL